MLLRVLSSVSRRKSISARLSRIVKQYSFSTSIDVSYTRKTPHEHVLLRPGMYIGQINPGKIDTWVYNSVMKKQLLMISPGLLKIFDETLVNACDNKQKDSSMSYIDVNITHKNDSELIISVRNDGKGVPVRLHPTEDNIYIPNLVFGHLLTGSNFDDDKARITGGRHGYGAKLANIFSQWFELETYDATEGLLYRQRWESNMNVAGPPVVTSGPGLSGPTEDYTLITFCPDLRRFHLDVASSPYLASTILRDTITLMHRRVVDVAACVSGVKVRINGEVVPVSSFKDYVNLFTGAANSSHALSYIRIGDRWEVAIGRSQSGAFEQLSFVNAVCTPSGGTHVSYVVDQAVSAIMSAAAKQGLKVLHRSVVQSKLQLIIRCDIENASFDSQSKDSLTSDPASFGSKCQLPPAFLEEFVKQSDIVAELLAEQKNKDKSKLQKAVQTKGRAIPVPKLEDAHAAGTKKASKCTLILTEGDSAKALAVAGLEEVGRDLYGVLPLRGKLLNVRGMAPGRIASNEELSNVAKALGLNFRKEYSNSTDSLRYGHIMLMADQDHDGSHIKGLVINFLQHFWPNLLKREGFLQQFITPLVKASVGARQTKDKWFYSLQEFEEWRKAETSSGAVRVKYYKGLGTNTAAEGKEYFKQLDHHQKFMTHGPKSADAIDLAFSKSRALDRRNWLKSSYKADEYLDPKLKEVLLEDFVNKELIHFSHADNVRSIPSVIDGLKPSQRKVLYACFKRKLTTEMKVVQLAGYVAEQTAYHHGEASLHSTIIRMAQDFIGSNNLPLLHPSGQFGTRSKGGKDSASPRYIFTKLNPVARLLFPEADDDVLDRMEEDGEVVEPKYFVPVIPLVLVNGSEGVGSGWRCLIPPHNPLHLLDRVEARVMQQKAFGDHAPLQPWVRGFKGEVNWGNGRHILFKGVAEKVNDRTVRVSELPVGLWTESYKAKLVKLAQDKLVTGVRETHSSTEVSFTLTVAEEFWAAVDKAGGNLLKALHLERTMHSGNMNAFDENSLLVHFDSTNEILEAHFAIRLDFYHRRKKFRLKQLQHALKVSSNKARFVQAVVTGELSIQAGKGGGARAIQDIEDDLRALKFDALNAAELASESVGYSYLLDMPLHSLSLETADKLNKKATASREALASLEGQSEEDLWLADLRALREEVQKQYS